MSQTQGWVARWKESKVVLEGFFATKTDVVANAIFNDIDDAVTFEQITRDQYNKTKVWSP